MKAFLRTISLAICVSTVTRAARAQGTGTDRPFSFGVMLGAAPFSNKFPSSETSHGYLGGGEVQLRLPIRRFAIRADGFERAGCLLPCGDKINAIQPLVPKPHVYTGPSKVTAWSIALVARLNDPKVWWSPYVIVGAETYSDEDQNLDYTGRPGLQAGGGFELKSRTLAYFVEYRYLRYTIGGVQPIVFGMRF